MTSALVRLASAASLAALLVLVAAPAGATHTSAHATDQIWAVEAQAEQDMDDVVDAFETEIAGMGSQDEVEVAEDAADDAIVALWTDVKKAIEDLVKLYPAELGGVGGAAKQQLQQKRNDTRTAISDLADAWVPTVSTTTTTTPATTTTTTTVVNATTTTTTTTTTTRGSGVIPPPPDKGNGNGNGNGNGHGNGNGGGSSSSNGQGGQTQPTVPENNPGPTPNGVTEPTSTDAVEDQVGSNNAILTLQTPEQTMGDDIAQGSSTQQTSGAGATARVAAMLETVLPPAVVELVLSPLLILEILLRTTLDGGQRIFGPLVLLALCAAMISLTDRFSRRASSATVPMHR